MRWVVLVMLVGCGDNIPEVPTTVVSVDVASMACSSCQSAYFDTCGTYFPLVETGTTQLQATTDSKLPLVALVQLQYSGELIQGTYGPDHPHLDYTLSGNDLVDVYAALDYTIRLYRINAMGAAVDIDPTHLDSTDGTLRFTYPRSDGPGVGTIVETHAIAMPRLVAVDATASGPLDACCSVGRPADLGIVAAALLMIVRRRRRTTR